MNNSLHYVYRLLFLVFCSLLIISFSACGRRGDPVVMSPYDDNVREDSEEADGGKGEQYEVPAGKGHSESQKETRARPDAPSRLMAVFTQDGIVLTWDEIIGQGVKLYRVYRSDGKDFTLIGESVIPAYTDSSVEKNKEYSYKVTAVTDNESPASIEIKVTAGSQ